jgi:hypothetical protein
MTTITAEDRASGRDVTGDWIVVLSALRRRGVVPALVAAQASVGVMVAVMTLTGAVVVDHFHHHDHYVFPIIGVHVAGMYALVIVVGDVIDRIGRTVSLSGDCCSWVSR